MYCGLTHKTCFLGKIKKNINLDSTYNRFKVKLIGCDVVSYQVYGYWDKLF